MGEKVYRPVMNTGDHLVQSKDNPARVRGLTRDINNQNPGIPEWEELDLDELIPSQQEPELYEPQHVQLTPEEEKLAEMAGEALGAAICKGIEILVKDVVSPWWKNAAWPWIKDTGGTIVAAVKGGKTKAEQIKMTKSKEIRSVPTVLPDVENQKLDEAFEQIYTDMDEETAREHTLRLVYHILGVANEIRILSNARISKECKSEQERIEAQQAAEKALSEKTSAKLNQLLSNETLHLDLNTSRKLFDLTGGGVYLNGEYVPVLECKIEDAVKKMTVKNSPHDLK